MRWYPCLRSTNGVTMLPFIGPGLNRLMSAMRSEYRSGCIFPSSSRWPGDSIWNIPRV